MNREIKNSTRVWQKKDVYLTELDDDRVMMDIDTGNYYVLNGIGSLIWDRIQEKTYVGVLIQELLNEFDVDTDTCKAQVIKYLMDLQQINLVMVEN